jgi:hypothetical protein
MERDCDFCEVRGVVIDRIVPLDWAKTSAAAAPSTESSCPHCHRAIFTNLTDTEQRKLGVVYLHPKYIDILGEVRPGCGA